MDIAQETINQLIEAGLWHLITDVIVESRGIRGVGKPALLTKLESNPKFKRGVLHGLHVDVGKNRRDYRAIKGSYGRGSTQVVIDSKTFVLYADVDNHSPYDDVVSFIGHSGEVIRGWFNKLKNI